MADKEPLPAPVVDLEAEMASLRASQAPLIFFEGVTTSGVRMGVANMTLEGGMHALASGKIANRSQVAAHLRFPVELIPLLRKALDDIELLAQPPASGEKN